MSRPAFLCSALIAIAAVTGAAQADKPRDVANEPQLLADLTLVKSHSENVAIQSVEPKPHEVILVTDKPWEGNTSAYYTIFQDGDLYRMYYRGSHFDEQTKRSAHREVACYAESRDGIHWTKPELGLFEFNGSKANNIVWDGLGTHNFTPFKDENPNCTPDARYKALARGSLPKQGDQPARRGLFAFKSPDGIRWSLMHPDPVITLGAFDSQNLAFWDPIRECYVDYHRHFANGVRDIMSCTSDDFVTWTKPEFLDYAGAPKEHLYTNTIRRYARAPHLLIGFPTRFNPKTQQVEPVLMTSRDGQVFRRFSTTTIPITAPKDRDGNRSNYMASGLVQIPSEPDRLSVFASEAYYTGPDSRLRRFSFRVDGFASARSHGAGELETIEMICPGGQLELNYRTEKTGSVRVSIVDGDGKPVEGFGPTDSQPLFGDDVAGTAVWKSNSSLKALAGQPIRVKLHLKDAEVFAFRFAP